MSTADTLMLRCALGVQVDTPKDLWCSCLVSCSRRPSDGQLRVTRSDPAHDCRLEREPRSQLRARKWGRAAIEALEREHAGRQSSAAREEEQESSQDGADSEDEVSQRLITRSVGRGRVMPVSPELGRVEGLHESSEYEDDDEVEVVVKASPPQRLAHLTLNGEFRRRIQQLARVSSERAAGDRADSRTL